MVSDFNRKWRAAFFQKQGAASNACSSEQSQVLPGEHLELAAVSRMSVQTVFIRC